MKSYSSKVRSLLSGGAKAIAITSVLIAVASCSHDKTDTDNLSSSSEVTTTCTTTTSTMTTSSTTATTTTTSTTTMTTMMTVLESTVQTEPPINIEPQTEPATECIVEYSASTAITERERVLLCNVVANEYGSDWVSVYDKACIVATVMNRVNSSQFPNDIESVLTQPYQFSGYWASDSYYPTVTQSCIEAVDYYFAHPEEFGGYMYFEGDGRYNYFH